MTVIPRESINMMCGVLSDTKDSISSRKYDMKVALDNQPSLAWLSTSKNAQNYSYFSDKNNSAYGINVKRLLVMRRNVTHWMCLYIS